MGRLPEVNAQTNTLAMHGYYNAVDVEHIDLSRPPKLESEPPEHPLTQDPATSPPHPTQP